MNPEIQTKMWFLASTFFGLVLGFILAWAYSAKEAHRRVQLLDPSARISTALLVSRVASIGLGLVVAVSTNLVILVNQPTLLNEVAYLGSTLAVAIGAWKFVLRPV
jgi:hypothetical protein